MVRRRYGLPSLNALAAFEAAARNLSVSRAADELNVTTGAVSKQLRQLEQDLGRKLFARAPGGIALTHAGEVLSRGVHESFEQMADTVRQLRVPDVQSNVSIATTMAIMQMWLMPRLGSFWAQHQDIVVDHLISDRAQEIARPDMDLRIRYGDGNWLDEEAVKLFSDQIIAVASPAFLEHTPIGSPAELAAAPLLAVEGADWRWTTWVSFLRETGTSFQRLNLRRFNSYVVAIQAARDGQGVALGWINMIGPLLTEGTLVRVTDLKISDRQGAYVTWNAGRCLSPAAEALRDWLIAQGG